ncbi:MAG: acetate--CoA ligase family protein [Pseudomonadota bacterium]
MNETRPISPAAAQGHRLSPLLAPASIALVGGSAKRGSVGDLMVRTLREGGYGGAATVVNPSLPGIDGFPVVGALSDLPTPPDLAVLSVSSPRMEAALADAIAIGARAAVIFDFCQIEHDSAPVLTDRLRALATEANIPVCGGNGMGFYNFDARTFVSFQEPTTLTPGNITVLCHSGSVFAMLADAAPRYGFNLLTAQGQEINGTIADYMDYALDQPTTRVVVLFAEAIRDPEAFVAALAKAAQRDIPVIVLKVGRTAASARFALTHSGALAGDHAAFEAICDRYGAIRVPDLDAMMAAAQVLAIHPRMQAGEMASLLDSGGLRELMLDLADDLGLPFAELAPHSVERLEKRIYFGLEPANPLDAAGPYTEELGVVMGDCLDILAEDPGVAGLAHELFYTDTTAGVQGTINAARQMPSRHAKPYALSYALGAAPNMRFATDMLASGVPVINGLRPMLEGVKAAFDYRAFRARKVEPAPTLPHDAVGRWRERLAQGTEIGETEALRMLADLGLETTAGMVVTSEADAVTAADAFGYPVVLKTAAAGVLHKSDSGGVHLNLPSADAVRAAYVALSGLGPEVAVAPMADPGVEIALGMVNDPQFGPIVMVSAGGTMVEILEDRAFAVAPISPAEADRMLQSLKVWKVLNGARGASPTDIDKLAEAVARFSVLCHELGDQIAEMDVNPVIAGPRAAPAVDAAVVLKTQAEAATT